MNYGRCTPVWTLLAAALTAFAFALGAGVPILVTELSPRGWSLYLLAATVVCGLTTTSIIAARSSHMNVWRTVRRSLISGVLALAASSLIGFLAK